MPGFLLPLLTLGFSCLYKASVAFSRSHLLLSSFIETIDSSHILISTYCMLVYSFSPVHLIMSPVVKAIIKCNVAFGQELSVQMTGSFLNPGVLIYLTCLPGLLPVPTFTGWVFSKQRWEFWVETVASQRRGNWRLTLECRFEIT